MANSLLTRGAYALQSAVSVRQLFKILYRLTVKLWDRRRLGNKDKKPTRQTLFTLQEAAKRRGWFKAKEQIYLSHTAKVCRPLIVHKALCVLFVCLNCTVPQPADQKSQISDICQKFTRSSAIAGRPCDAIACQRLLKWTWKWESRLKWPSNVLQSHQKWHQSKASVWFPISSL